MAKRVRAKKQLGQHFLTDLSIAKATVDAFNEDGKLKNVLEVGAGMGVLTKFITARKDLKLTVIDIDTESIEYLKKEDWINNDQLIDGDFLGLDLRNIYGDEPFGILGNFPYNISTQILFKALEYKDQCLEVVGMFQKEVAERIASREGSKVYGITSILLQAYFDIDYLFTVHEDVFDPQPKVKSAVIRLKRNNIKKLPCDEKLFKQLVKVSFNQRRKTMRNSLKQFLNDDLKVMELFTRRPESLSVQEFIDLSNLIKSAEPTSIG
ncbi:16S rRNA (adenine(1518)-N(6)/adenine(1519)-N(6))-dimethyltransferase RsmA [Vicingaceae bacterium]|nr:16S rRNA (adenine(1518)-N(6)/adenine(1519)-N(6))-dimethyltransferase RsmA [Vicingaceae bacterium]MDA9782940.1 16S rRNA (adenine(1518)-N(6)/adenine(1519)-N(6))-dimethyltransferase RsmA [Vicingaceae bacterium]MDB4062072.1 16S rRNA (adenine(1518)-N(6)/adenine(1519)-N(6))-dimethyltransferase RsmA [Vicingaceae bacterium]MDB4083220.1 16S rRNA (adenine(1518)-N(6)/adenine(1519)-N(6))-dimethyltransferase RsmA [Vicingaceae bacterium]